jgi:hypothetical protein
MKLSVGLSALLGAAVTFYGLLAVADEEFDVTLNKGEIVIVTKGHWHVNKDYPWKATAGDATFDKSKFSFTETSAKLSGLPHGSVKLKGAVCDGPQCMPFTKELSIQ